jgi:hypothetical protein
MKPVQNTRLTARQAQYLDFIQRYIELHGRSPAEAEIASHFGVSASAAHQMVLALEAAQRLARTPGEARSLRVLPNRLGDSGNVAAPHRIPSAEAESDATAIVEPGILIAREMLRRQFAHVDRCPIDDAEFAPLVGSLLQGFESGLLAAGVVASAAGQARDRLQEEAVSIYTAWCARNDPENADADVDRKNFLYLMKHGRWPRGR